MLILVLSTLTAFPGKFFRLTVWRSLAAVRQGASVPSSDVFVDDQGVGGDSFFFCFGLGWVGLV